MITPNSWGSTLMESNDCHDPKSGEFCDGGDGPSAAPKSRRPRDLTKTEHKLLDDAAHPHRVHGISLQWGFQGRRRFGSREREAAMRLVKRGYLKLVGKPSSSPLYKHRYGINGSVSVAVWELTDKGREIL